MLPENRASTIPLPGAYLRPDERNTSPIEDYELGGIALNDASQGLMVRVWRAWLDVVNVYIQAEGDPAPTLLFSDDQISEISLCFDQNMRWAIGYTQNGILKLRWFDSLAEQYVITTFEKARNPKMSMDDKRPMHLNTNDMLLAYIKDDKLCYRQQRDRFQIERVLRDGLLSSARLKNIGMNRNLRMQFELV